MPPEETAPTNTPAPAAPPAPDPTPPAPPTPDPTPPVDESVTLTKAEVEALRRQAREGREAQKAADKAKRDAEEHRAKEQGEWQKLAEAAQRERDEAISRAGKVSLRAAATAAAAKANFYDPGDVLLRHEIVGIDPEDVSAIEDAVGRIAKAAPHLIRPTEPPRPVIGQVHAPDGVKPTPGGPTGPELTWADVQQMNAQQVNERWDDVQKVLAAGPPK